MRALLFIDSELLLDVIGGEAKITKDATSEVVYDNGVYVNGVRGGDTAGATANITARNGSTALVSQRVNFTIGKGKK